MGVKVKRSGNWDKFMNDPIAFAEQFPCPKCGTVSKRIAEKKFYCPKCNVNFELDVNYVDSSKDGGETDADKLV